MSVIPLASGVSRYYVTIKKLLFREALLFQLFQLEDMQLVGESSTGVDTLNQLRSTGADVLIIEEDLQDNDGLTISEIALSENPALNILLFVDAELSSQRLAIYLESGIKSVVTLDQPLKEFVKALEYVKRGQVYVQGNDPHSQARSEKDAFLDLSEREREVAILLVQRLEVKLIADRLGVSYKTVHSYKDRILIKLGIDNLSELILFMNRYRSSGGADI